MSWDVNEICCQCIYLQILRVNTTLVQSSWQLPLTERLLCRYFGCKIFLLPRFLFHYLLSFAAHARRDMSADSSYIRCVGRTQHQITCLVFTRCYLEECSYTVRWSLCSSGGRSVLGQLLSG